MRKYGLMIAAMLLCAVTEAGTLDSLITRLDRFGRAIPQEKVYVHMDNTCYFLGDTIWFAAYTRQTNDGRPSNISRILYVELYNQDGYLMERQLIEMKDGRGHGNFVLKPSYYYGGYYELRAYTRWQLNWGRFEHKHSRVAGQWFINKEKEAQFYRDYDKLYSRVFPVYDQPKQQGVFDRDMTLRPLRRYFRKDPDKRTLQLSLFPEGGNLVKGLPCRMAFEACYSDGEWVEGVLRIGNDSAVTVHRGRGTIALTQTSDLPRPAVFATRDGLQAKAQLPKAETSGVALRMQQENDAWSVQIDATEDMPPHGMAVTIMHEGLLQKTFQLTGLHTALSISADDLPAGVNQLTVFDGEGRVWADRLFFVRNGRMPTATLAISGIKDFYDPFEEIELEVNTAPYNPPAGDVEFTINTPHRGATGGVLSLSVRDRDNQEYLYDSGNLLTEMLLASEIKGFVPQPEWYFEADDEMHRQGLELLMMTQGWRRFVWQDMAVSGRWEIEQPAEKYQILMGKVTTEIGDSSTTTQRDNSLGDGTMKREVLVHAELVKLNPQAIAKVEGRTSDKGRFQLFIPRFEGHSVFFLAASDSTKWRKGHRYEWVRMIPSETDRFEKLRYNWRFRDKDPKALHVSIDFPYPRFVSPYHFFQSKIAPEPEDTSQRFANSSKLSEVRQLREVKVRAKRNGLRKFSDAYPAFSVDAYEAYNLAYDAGLKISMDRQDLLAESVVRAYVGDMGLDYPYYDYIGFKFEEPSVSPPTSGIRIRYGPTSLRRTIGDMTVNQDSLYLSENLSSVPLDGTSMPNIERELTYGFSKIDRYVIYTDYMPRLEGDRRYEGSNMPETNVVLYPLPDGGERATYRDRRLILPGFAIADDFYHPDYSRRPLPDTKDYRRTLYWNPDLQLDDDGKATIRFYNNSQQTRIAVSVDGMTKEGVLLTGRE